MAEFQYLFSPIKLGSVTVRNRIINTTHGPGVGGHRYARYLEERAKGGVGLICIPAGYGCNNFPVGPAAFVGSYAGYGDFVLPNPVSPEGIRFLDETIVPLLRSHAEVIHRHGAAVFGQIYLGSSTTSKPNWQPVLAASQVPDDWLCQVPHELEIEEIQDLVAAAGQAARRAKEAGLDGLEVHSANGHLIHNFLSPYTNKRNDKYGGSLDNRLRLLLEVIEAARERVGKDFPIGVRLPGEDFVDGGLTVQDMQQIARRLAPQAAYLSISGATRVGLRGGVTIPYVAPWYIPLGPYVPFAAAIREAVDIPIAVANRINDPVLAEKLIAEGQTDMVGMVRALIADPELPNKARQGRLDDIRKCIGCNVGCRLTSVQRHGSSLPIGCTVNAAVGREEEMEIKPAQVKKKVLIAGGGPAGMEAARVAALRGHQVTLYEKEKELGGHVAIIARDPNRQEWGDLVRYLEGQLRKLKVEVRLGVTVTPELVAEQRPDAVVTATGAEPFIPPVPGVNSPNVATAPQVLKGEARVGQRVLVVGGKDGDLNPMAMAEFLADQGKRVEVLSEMIMVGQDIEPITLNQLTRRVLDKGCTLTPLTGLRSIGERKVVVYNTFTKRERVMEDVDTVVLAAGARANVALYRSLKGKVKELYAIGDCLAPRRTLHAVLEGSRAGRQL